MNDITRKSDEITRRNFAATLARRCLGVSMVPAFAGLGNRAWAADTSSGKADRVIYLYMSGGMTHLDTLDPKPNTEVQGPTKTVKTPVPGVLLSEHMPALAKMLNKVSYCTLDIKNGIKSITYVYAGKVHTKERCYLYHYMQTCISTKTRSMRSNSFN